jgi:hypothetical protein
MEQARKRASIPGSAAHWRAIQGDDYCRNLMIAIKVF